MGRRLYSGEVGNNGYANFWGINKVHYGLCENGELPLMTLQAKVQPFDNENRLAKVLTYQSAPLIQARFQNKNKQARSGCKDNHSYSLPFGQAEASIY